MTRTTAPSALFCTDDTPAGLDAANLLRARGWRVTRARGADAMAALQAAEYAVAVLDRALREPGWDELLANRRGLPGDPRLLVLCTPGEVYQLLRAPARSHAYGRKPAAPEQVAAWVEALARGMGSNLDACLVADGIALDPLARCVYLPGRALELPKREFDLLHLLMSRRGQVVTRDESARYLYRWGQDIGSNAIDVHIHSLRRRFSPTLIRTVRGAGYVLG